MAVAKKGLRKINMNGENFHWKIRKKISHNEAHNSEYKIPIQHEMGGQILLIQVGFCRSHGYDSDPILSVTPSLIKEKILEAINLGWQFNLKGKPIHLLKS